MIDEATARASWQRQAAEPRLPTMDELRAGSAKFYRRIRLRNTVEYAACVFVVLCFGAYAVALEHVLQRIGAAMIVAGTVVVAWQLHRRASAVRIEATGEQAIFAAIRAQLVRQRDALAGIFWWYLLPFIPGLVVMTVGSALLNPGGGPHGPWLGIAVVALMVAVFVGTWLLNRWGARYLQRKIDQIDAWMGDGR